MKFSANLGFLWPGIPLLERIDAAAAVGFRAIELHWPYDVSPRDVRAAAARNNLTILGLNTPLDAEKKEFGLGAVPGRQDDFRKGFSKAADYSRAIGANSIHVMAGDVPTDKGEGAAAQFAENLAWAATQAPDLTLLLEPINRHDRPHYFLNTCGQAAEIIMNVSAANIRLMFDFYHVGISEDAPIELFKRHFSLVSHVQIAAVPSRAEPDEGRLDYRVVFNALETLGYDGWIGCEYKPRSKTETGLNWTENLDIRLSG